MTPCILTFCERPDYLELKDGRKLIIDFWLQRPKREMFLVLHNRKLSNLEFTKEAPINTRFITTKELDKWPYLLKNWQSMLPYMAAQHRWITEQDIWNTQVLCDRPMTLACLENRLSTSDHTWARSCVFSAIARGLVKAPSLNKASWTTDMLIIPNSYHG
jgi:hypothetical protein